jgi:hypothetical protein
VRLHPVLIALVVPALLLSTPSPASAAAGDVGYDVSYPQCDAAAPTGGAFLVVGVNGGLPWSSNPCLPQQVGWAGPNPWQLYVNTADRGPESPYWPAAGTGYCTSGGFDAGCAYEYGRSGATDAMTRAVGALGEAARARTWWLDVEIGNSWNGTGSVNTAALQGFADALRQAGVPEVGVYSTGYQWGEITGGYTRANSASYRAGWPVGMAKYPLEDGPVWLAGATSLANAQAKCGDVSFTGGERLLVQWMSTYDVDYRCADPDRIAPTATTTGPVSRVTLASTVRVTWGGSDSGSGLASHDLRWTRAASNGTFGAWQAPTSTQRLLTRYRDLARAPLGYTTCFATRARDAAGNVSAWTPSRCSAVPLDDRALTASSSWSRATTSGWLQGTSTVTTRYGATLKRTGLQTKRLHLVARRCSTCGKVAVYVGGSLLTTVNLYASTSSRAVIALPTIRLRTTTVTLKVVSSGKTVRIDGLASSRA